MIKSNIHFDKTLRKLGIKENVTNLVKNTIKPFKGENLPSLYCSYEKLGFEIRNTISIILTPYPQKERNNLE